MTAIGFRTTLLAMGVLSAALGRGAAAGDEVAGAWNATMTVGEHTLRFTIEIPSVPGRDASILLGGERFASASVSDNGMEVRLEFPLNNSRINATRVGEQMYGEWVRERVVGGNVTVERLDLIATRGERHGEGTGAATPVRERLPLRWISEPDDCGSAHSFMIRCDARGAVMARTVGSEGRIINYAGEWDEPTGTLTLMRFDGEEAEVIVAAREGRGPLVGQYWLGRHMPLPWAVHPVATLPSVRAASESGAVIAYP